MGWGKAAVMREGRAGQDLLLSTCGLLIAATREVSRANQKAGLSGLTDCTWLSLLKPALSKYSS